MWAVENPPQPMRAGYTRLSSVRQPDTMRTSGLGREGNLEIPRLEGLVDRSGRLQIHLFPLSLNDALANLFGSFPLLMLSIGVIHLFQASGALRSVSAFEAAM